MRTANSQEEGVVMEGMKALAYLARGKVGSGYVWGAQGERLDIQQLKKFINKFGEDKYFTKTHEATKWIGYEVFDCSGLVVWCMRTLKLFSPTEDYTAAGLQVLCTPIPKNELEMGCLCFNKEKNSTHVGIYMGKQRVIEARGRNYGVVESDVDRFSYFGILNYDFEKVDPVRKIQKLCNQSPDLRNIKIDGIPGIETMTETYKIFIKILEIRRFLGV
jgi:hypothetical protein